VQYCQVIGEDERIVQAAFIDLVPGDDKRFPTISGAFLCIQASIIFQMAIILPI
jgi:hypothetical protein